MKGAHNKGALHGELRHGLVRTDGQCGGAGCACNDVKNRRSLVLDGMVLLLKLPFPVWRSSRLPPACWSTAPAPRVRLRFIKPT